MRLRILITRPEPGAARTAGRLREIGFEPVVLPLTRIERLSFEISNDKFDGVLVTSAQALSGGDFSRLSSLPMIAVGEMTAKAAVEAGFSGVVTASGSAESVAGHAVLQFKRGARLLYICGKVRRPELESLLGEAGFLLTAVETYKAVPVEYAEGALVEALGGEPFQAVVLMSAAAGELFLGLAARPQLQNALLVCFSQRIAEAVKLTGSPISVTGEATEESLIVLLQARFKKPD